MTNREDLIRARAHAMWEAEGCPDGRDDQHWHQATIEIESAERDAMLEPTETAPTTAPVPAPAAKPARAPKTKAATPSKPRPRRAVKS